MISVETLINDTYSIYVHINKINGKMYIGQTVQTNLNNRWVNGYGYKGCTRFYNAIQKYGWDNFEHIVLFDKLTLDMANVIEEELIKKFQTTNDKYGYNIKFGGTNMRHLDETKNKISIAHIGLKHSVETKNKIRENHADFSGENHPSFGKKLTKETREKISKSHHNVSGKNNPMYGRTHTDDIRMNISLAKSKKVYQYDDDNNFTSEYSSVINAKKETGICNVTIAQCCRGIVKHAGGYVWRYERI